MTIDCKSGCYKCSYYHSYCYQVWCSVLTDYIRRCKRKDVNQTLMSPKT